MTTRPTGACLVLVTQVNMVRGPHTRFFPAGVRGCFLFLAGDAAVLGPGRRWCRERAGSPAQQSR